MAHRAPLTASALAAGGSGLRRPGDRPAERPDSCLGRTCMKWGADGELSALDLQLVLERLSRVDGCADALVNANDA